ncbi:MAG: hypothetical protein AMJ46_08170 [Latescibacteria bacterium DG_63]|nr:MAG: hypothetical protein AMJ46_08170 [Latescibacteria bacterium DG_63]
MEEGQGESKGERREESSKKSSKKSSESREARERLNKIATEVSKKPTDGKLKNERSPTLNRSSFCLCPFTGTLRANKAEREERK